MNENLNMDEGIFSDQVVSTDEVDAASFATSLETEGAELAEAIATEAAAVATAIATGSGAAVKDTTGLLAHAARWASAHKVMAGGIALLGVILIARRMRPAKERRPSGERGRS